MTFETLLRRSTASMAVVAALAAAPVAAQDDDSSNEDQSEQSSSQSSARSQDQNNNTQSSSEGSQESSSGESQSSDGTTQALDPDQVIALVGDSEITGADLTGFVETLPPRMRQQPPQMLMSMGLQQLVLRELLLQRALANDLDEDPEVVALVEESANVAREDAMVRVLLQRELEARVTDEQVQKAYDTIAKQTEQDLPPLEQIRPQIERRLQQQAVQSLREDLAADVDVVVYGPDGEPVQGKSSDGSSGSSSNASDSESSSGSGSSEGPSDSQ